MNTGRNYTSFSLKKLGCVSSHRRTFYTFSYPGGNINNSSKTLLRYPGLIPYFNNISIVPYYNFKPVRHFPVHMFYFYTQEPRKITQQLVTEFINEYDKDCFIISVFKHKRYKLGEGVYLVFKISSERLPCERVERLINSFPRVFACGQILRTKYYITYIVKDFISINGKIIPFFNEYLLHGRKLEAFEYWKQVAYLMSHKAHSNPEGLNDIKKIKLLMNNVKIQEHFGLVLYGSNLSSTVGSPRYTYCERALIKIPNSKRSVFIGIILSDATIQKQNLAGDARLQFKQNYSHLEYFYSVFFQLSHYCSKGPYKTKTILHKRVHYGLAFTTRSLLCITELYHLFYYEGKKVIPKNLFFLLTWEALVHLIIGDGTYSSGITLQTQCFTLKELVHIVNVLIIKFRLECNIHKQANYNVIYIKSKSIKNNLHHMLPYIHPTMIHKFKGWKYKLKSKYTKI